MPTARKRMNSDQNPIRIATLSDADARTLDALLQTTPNAPAAPLPPAEAQRAQKITRLLELIRCQPTLEPPADLTQRTLEKIAQAEQRRRMAMQIQALANGPAAFHWRELATVAAMLLIGISLTWPMLSQTRNDARQIVCQNRLAAAGMALGRYADDNAGLMPRLPVQPNAMWATVGNPSNGARSQSNPAHLYLLVRGFYIDPNTLACPDNPNAPRNLTAAMHDWPNAPAVSYSYQNQFTLQPNPLNRCPSMAILADKNPLFVVLPGNPHVVAYRPDLQPTTATPFHGQRGQNILIASGNVFWNSQPVLKNGDNIWLAAGVSAYNGTETPSRPDDSFLIP